MKSFLMLPTIALVVAMSFSTANADLVNFSFADGSAAQDAGDIFMSTDVTFGPFTGGAVNADFPTTGISAASGGPFVRTNATGATTGNGDSLTDAIANGNYVGFTVTNNTSDDYSLDEFSYGLGLDNRFNNLNASTFLLSDAGAGFVDTASLGTASITNGAGNEAQTDRTIDVSSLDVLAPSDSIEFRLYFVDSSTAVNRIFRTSNFELSGTVAAVPEPSSIALLGLGGVAMLIRRRK